MFGADGNDVIIGGIGRDLLFGGLGDNLLIGADLVYSLVSPFDSSPQHGKNRKAYDAILREWARTDLNGSAAAKYAVRIAHLTGARRGGLNGSYHVNSSTVFDDRTEDLLFPSLGLDWLVTDKISKGGLDQIFDLHLGGKEQVLEVGPRS